MIKYVLLDTYNLVQSRNLEFIPCVIDELQAYTKLPWEECAYALAEATNYFRMLNSADAFICNPEVFAVELCDRLISNRQGANFHPSKVHKVLYMASITALPHGNSECFKTIEYLLEYHIQTGLISNTNMFSSIEIATQIELEYHTGMVQSYSICNGEHIQMPNDRIWADLIQSSGFKANEILFVTTNSRYATNASASNIEVAVVSGYDELFKAVEKRINIR